MNKNTRIVIWVIVLVLLVGAVYYLGGNLCRIAGEEPEKFGFGVAWEKDWSYAQGIKSGNMIFVAGQLAHGQEVDENGMPEFLMGDFEQQFRAVLENIKAVLANYGSTMDDVVFLQNFVCPETRSGNKAGDYNDIAAGLIREYFPNGLHTMTFVEVAGLYADPQLVESNAIAIVKK
ncbi:MAG: RidA family protein [Patescibacteria group bacterium]|nr:RidA family protein [Patescibacteria group bacterium]